MNWFKERVGLQDPIYGPSAIHPVTKQAETHPYTELSKDDLKWYALNSTSVETQCFYVTADSGHFVLAQVIYNNVGGLRTICQFSCKIFYPETDKPFLWSTDALEHWGFDEKKYSFHADNVSIALSEDGESYHVKSSRSRKAVVNLTFRRTAPGFHAGNNGTTTYGTDPKQPWGSMSHAFWPRCKVEGSILTQQGELEMSGRGVFIHALQGMRPNLAAASWNFVNFQSPTYSALIMEFTTPPSYGSTKVSIGCIALDGQLLIAGGNTHITHTNSKPDPEVGWPEPQSIKLLWSGKDKDNQAVEAEISGALGPRLDRIDVLDEVPRFIKQIIASAAGTKPYIYQFQQRMPLKIKIGEETNEESGRMFMEATFITGDSKSQ